MLILLAPESTTIYRIIYPKTVINFIYYPAYIINKKLFLSYFITKNVIKQQYLHYRFILLRRQTIPDLFNCKVFLYLFEN